MKLSDRTSCSAKQNFWSRIHAHCNQMLNNRVSRMCRSRLRVRNWRRQCSGWEKDLNRIKPICMRNLTRVVISWLYHPRQVDSVEPRNLEVRLTKSQTKRKRKTLNSSPCEADINQWKVKITQPRNRSILQIKWLLQTINKSRRKLTLSSKTSKILQTLAEIGLIFRTHQPECKVRSVKGRNRSGWLRILYLSINNTLSR